MNIRSHVVAALTDIDGIAQRTAEKLATEGITTLQQIRDLTEDEVDRLDVKLGLRGQPRLLRWREQAADLLANQETQEEPASETPTVEPAPDREAVMAKLASQLAALQEAETKAKKTSVPSVNGNGNGNGEKRLRLNRNRDFGETYGNFKDENGIPTGASFSQLRNGREVFFNYAQVEIRPGDKSQPDPDSDEVEGKHEATDFSDFHPTNYLDGKQEYPFEFVRRAVQSRYGRNVKTDRHARAMLHEQLRQNH